MTYTVAALAAVAVAVAVDVLVLRTRLVARRAFWVADGLLVVGQLVTNGLLAGKQVVRYDPQAIVGGAEPRFVGGGRLAWAPVEDLLFGFALALVTLALWVFWGRRGVQREPLAGPPRWRQAAPEDRTDHQA